MNIGRLQWAISGAVLLLILPGTGLGCSCGGRPPTPVAYRAASDVFIGMVVDVQQPPREVITNNRSVSVIFPAGPGLATLQVLQSLKGVQEPKVVFELEESCSIRFQLNESYLVYAVSKDGKLNTNKCTRTRLRSRAAPDLEYIQGLMAGRSQATLHGDVFREALNDKGEPGLFPPGERLTVVLEPGTDKRFETKADESGEYEITVPPGEYHLWCERQGELVSNLKQPIVLKEGECRRLILPVKFEP